MNAAPGTRAVGPLKNDSAAAVEAEWSTPTWARSLATMLRERPFAGWAKPWGKRVVREVRRIFRVATRDLIALQKKHGTAQQHAAVLQRIVTELNAFDIAERCIGPV